MQTNMKRAIILVLALGMGACSAVDWGVRKKSAVEDGVWRDHYRTQKFAENDFMMEVIRFADNRIPREKMPDPSQNVIYEYNPEELLSGVNYRLPVLFDKHFDLSHHQDPVYKVELELLRLRTVVRTGNVMSGMFGKYDVEMEVDVTVRRPDSSILLRDTEEVHLDRMRKSMKGRDPSADLDRERMYDLTEAAVQKLAQKITWKVRQAHRNEVREEKLRAYEEQQDDFGVKD